MFEFNPGLIEIILFAVAVSAFICAAVFGLRKMYRVGKYNDNDSVDSSSELLPKVSVIVYAHKNGDIIEDYLEMLLGQDYPDFEVIVVNDFVRFDNTADVLESMMVKHKNLYMTFAPEDSRNVSRRKLALTLGMKAAKSDIVITTSANCIIQSDRWLYKMARHFVDADTDIVLGYTHPDKNNCHGLGRWYRRFDIVASASQWIGSALLNSPYRGDGMNLAFRKRLFFDRKGYLSSMRFQNGDDDIFINEIATQSNTVVEIDADAQLIVDWGKSAARMWKYDKERYYFTSQYLHTRSFAAQRFSDICCWLMLLSVVASGVAALPELWFGIAGVLLSVAFWTMQVVCFRRAAVKFQSKRLWWSVPLFWLLRPVVDSFYRIGFRANKSSNYTWRREKQL